VSNPVLNLINSTKVIPVVVIDNLEDAVPLSQALVDGGLKVLEVTLRTPVALQAITEIKKSVAGAIVGTGTVICPKTLEQSLDVDADFLVSPGVTNKLLDAAKQNNAPLLPGAATASEVMNLLDLGYQAMKFFPAAAAGGVQMLKSFAGPLPQATFCPTGGIKLTNANEYLKLTNVACVGGTWMLDKQLIANKDWTAITKLASQACQL
jgi:2-dehydro-3-deoxyphosphogluconate aldolase / (4S)-4-hydroxy-2-oxoglutarate aldolase